MCTCVWGRWMLVYMYVMSEESSSHLLNIIIQSTIDFKPYDFHLFLEPSNIMPT